MSYRRLLLSMAALLSLLSSGSGAQDHEAAVRHIAQSIESYGGLATIRALPALRIHGRGTADHGAIAQGVSPDRVATVPIDEWLTIDRAAERVSHEYRMARSDGSLRWRRFSYEGNDRVVLQFGSQFVSRRPDPTAPRIRRELMRAVPQLLLLEAQENPRALRAVGDTVINGRRHQVIAYTPPDRTTPLLLSIDAESRLLTAVRYVADMPNLPGAHVELIYRRHGARPRLGPFPSGYDLRINGRLMQAMAYADVSTDARQVMLGFAIPDELTAQSAPPGSILEPAPGVFVVHALDGFTSMFVEMRDFVVVIEAPAHGYVEMSRLPADALPRADSLGSVILRRIRERIPRKPIRYITISHYHNDHSGGLGAFAEESVTVLTTPDTRDYVRRIYGIPAAAVQDRQVITDGQRTIEVLRVGANLHTDDALVVYLPQEGILYQGDQFYFAGDPGFPPRDRLLVMQEFARWVDQRRLRVERIYGTHMTGFAGRRHLDDVLQLPSTWALRADTTSSATRSRSH